MANKQCVGRLQKEYRTLLKEPVPHIVAHPNPANILEWHFTLEGASDTDYKGGVYHGKLTFPPQYPFKPPSISLYTPTGRFATNTRLCLSMSDFHPESWNPMWSVGTILTGLLSFLYDSQATTGSITTSSAEKQRLAAESLAFNVRNPMFRKLFPEWVAEHERRQAAPPGVTQPPQQTAQTPQTQPPQQPGPKSQADTAAGGGGAQQAAVAGQPQAAAHANGNVRGGAKGAGAPAAQTSLLTYAVVAVVVAIVLVPMFMSSPPPEYR